MTQDRRWTRVREAIRLHQLLGDAALALGLVVFSIGMLLIDRDTGRPHQLTTSDIVALAFAVLAVIARSRFTITALIASVVATNLFLAVDHQYQPTVTAALSLLVYTYATRTDRRSAWFLTAGIAVILTVCGLLWTAAVGDSVGVLAWIGMGTAIGDATRTQRAYIEAVEERARRAEQSQDDKARLRVAQERVRIARDLHDAVAHHIAVVKVQATGAKHVLSQRPDAAATALDNISRASDAVLKEMAAVIGLLRTASDVTTGSADTDPGSGLARLPVLIDYLSSVGLRVEHRQVGDARELPPLTDLAAYQIAREALTNANKYGDGTARLTVTYAADLLAVEITNRIGDHPGRRGAGYGIVGMRERATANGGTVKAGRSGRQGFAVRFELPLTAQSAAK
ncbi:sensor histidine kinase [Paractinoplanes brasiliensis]|nr:histidine kinase [Actinoplanes brasiliensis]